MRTGSGGFLIRGNTILLGKRSDYREFYPGLWDVIGGHCEANETPAETLKTDRSRPATKAELLGLFGHLEAELDACGFLRVAEKRPSMVRNLRNIFQRARLTEQEVRTLRGVVTGLVEFGRRKSDGS